MRGVVRLFLPSKTGSPDAVSKSRTAVLSKFCVAASRRVAVTPAAKGVAAEVPLKHPYVPPPAQAVVAQSEGAKRSRISALLE